MEREPRPDKQAKEFVENVRTFVSRLAKRDGLIYSFDVSNFDDFDTDEDLTIKMLRALGAGRNTITVYIEIVGYNASSPHEIIDIDDAAYLGRRFDADIDPHDGFGRPSVEIVGEFTY